MVNNFIMAGKLGDFLHAMFAVKQICQANNIKANVYMCDHGWEFGVHNTYEELAPIFLQQDYVKSFNILADYELDPIQIPNQNTPIRIYNKQILEEGYIDLTSYIRSPWLYQTCWSELYSKTFNFKIQQPYSWITYNKTAPELENKILIQRKYSTYVSNPNFPYQEIINYYGKRNVLFISSSDRDYDEFPWKNDVGFLKVKTLDEWFTCINSCEEIIANLSAPAVISHALDKKRIIELTSIPDAMHCIGEERYSSKIRWFVNQDLHTLT